MRFKIADTWAHERRALGARNQDKGYGVNNRFSTQSASFYKRDKITKPEPKAAGRWRQLAVGGVLVALSACGGGEPELTQGSIGYVSEYLGAVVADEPRAALVGRDILSSGGSAADAATAMYFTLAVTMPSRAGIGGGGMCLAFDAQSAKTQALDFTAPAPKTIHTNADRPSAVPGNPRGFFALQARFGVLDWRVLVAPGEKLAQFGHPASRAFSRDLQAIGPALLADEGARAMFAGPGGRAVAKEGDKLAQRDLAATLGMLRGRGVGPFYAGPFARNFVENVNAAGGSLTVEDLRGFTPKWRETVRVEVGNEVAHFAPPPAAASAQAAIMLAMLEKAGNFDGMDEGERAHMLAETAVHTFADRETWLSADGRGTKDANALVTENRIETLVRGLRFETRTDPNRFVPRPQNRHETAATTSFAAVDNTGNAVACSVTMNFSFGTGRVAQGSGVLLAAAPGTGGRGPTGLAPMLMVNEHSKEFRMAAVAGGGVAAPSALAGVVARITQLGETAKDAVSAPRVHNGGDPDVTYIEPGFDANARGYLTALGHRIAETPVLGSASVLYCPYGLPTSPATCQMVADPRGAGLAAGSMIK